MAEILVLGGGSGGIVAANLLREKLDPSCTITLLDRRDKHLFCPSLPLVYIKKRKPTEITRNLNRLCNKGINFLQTKVKEICTEKSQVITESGTIGYDFLVIALGAEHHEETVPGFAEGALNAYTLEGAVALCKQLDRFDGGKIIFFVASLPYTGPIAPYESVLLLDWYFRSQGINHRVELVLITPEPYPEPMAKLKVGESIRRFLKTRNIKLLTGAKILSVDAQKKTLKLDHGISLKGDLLIGIPPLWGPDILRQTNLVDVYGWVKVNPFSLATTAANVYAIGDITSLKLPIKGAFTPKAGVFAHAQAKVVVNNITAAITGETKRDCYKGTGGLVMLTGFNQGRLSLIDYYKMPNPLTIMGAPAKFYFLMKVAFEKYWLQRWF